MSCSRLTGWDKESVYVRECFERNEAEGGCADMDSIKCNRCEANLQVVQRLAKYEDSGLTPEEVINLNGFVEESLRNWDSCEENKQKDPWCYKANDDPYPLCLGRGLKICQDCCLYENMNGPYDE